MHGERLAYAAWGRAWGRLHHLPTPVCLPPPLLILFSGSCPSGPDLVGHRAAAAICQAGQDGTVPRQPSLLTSLELKHSREAEGKQWQRGECQAAGIRHRHVGEAHGEKGHSGRHQRGDGRKNPTQKGVGDKFRMTIQEFIVFHA